MAETAPRHGDADDRRNAIPDEDVYKSAIGGGDAGDSPEKVFNVPSLEGRYVFLRAVEPHDYDFLRAAETSSSIAAQWRLRGATPAPEQWAQGLWNGVLAQFMVIGRADNRPIGLVAFYQADFQNRNARLAATRFDLNDPSPLLMLGIGVALDYVFACWSFHKLYMEVPEYNYEQIASGLGTFFKMEGRLRNHYVFSGRRWDQIILTIYREDWEARRRRLNVRTPERVQQAHVKLPPRLGR